jgi:hypothetical protein
LPAPVANFDDAADAAAQYRRASRSENTRRAYRSAVARFTQWCSVHRRTALPASPETVAAFLAAEARAELAVNTLRGHRNGPVRLDIFGSIAYLLLNRRDLRWPA